MIRVVFFGTPDVAVPALIALDEADDIEVVAVVTNPDRARGRSKTPQPPPVKVAAESRGIPVLQPWPAADVVDDLERLAPDVCAVVAYGSILRPAVLAAGGAGFVNLHFSLLPRWRGAAPVQHALLAGDAETGVTTFVLDEGMDTGPILRTLAVPILDGENAGELLDRLADVGAPILVDALRDLVGGVTPTPQPEDGVTYAGKLQPEDGLIDWTRPGERILDQIRGLTPAPGVHTTWKGERFKIHDAGLVAEEDHMTYVVGCIPPIGYLPGQIMGFDENIPVVATGDGPLRLHVVQPPGKARMDAAAWVNGYRPGQGDAFGESEHFRE